MSSALRSELVTVLVVDDERGLADLYAAWLSDEYDTETAYTGRDGLEAIDDGVDVVFLDRRMPDVSGDEVLSEVRDRGYGGYVAMLTAVEPDVDIIGMGFDHYLVKPVSQDDLNRTVERFLEWNEYDRRLQELFALVEKRATLRDEKSDEELRRSAEHRRLLDEIERLQRDADELLDGWETGDFKAILRNVP